MRIANFSFLFLSFSFVFPFSLQALEISSTDLELLNKIQNASIQYFVRMSDKKTGLTKDSSKSGSPASIAATGFSLAAHAIGQSRGWINPDYAKKQITKTLRTLVSKTEHQKGFYYHFVDVHSGRRVWNSEASSIDTALLVAGALVAAQYYPGTSIDRMAQKIYNRIDWRWMMNGSDFICMGWKPETGFLPYYWDSYSEHMILQALALSSSTHPVPLKTWERWMRPLEEYNGRRIVFSASGSLFTYQFAHAFIDFRKLEDNGINYFENSREASFANREYSLSFRDQYKSYHEKSWGLSASLGPGGYRAYGAKPGAAEHDGTIAPYAAIASIVFTPEKSLEAIRHFYFEQGESLYGIFGFKDAFNLDKGWWAQEYLGIDQGITVLMLENFTNKASVWKKFMQIPAIQEWINKCSLKNEKPAQLLAGNTESIPAA